MVGLDRARKRQLKEYSKGMTRRIGLAQALINEPELILLDEPTSGLDPIGTREMKDMILRLKDEGKTVVMCSHLLADVQDVCDRIAILHQGELKELGRVDTLLTVADVTQIRAEASEPDNASDEIRQVDRAAQRRAGQRRASDDDARRTVPVDRARQRSPTGPAGRARRSESVRRHRRIKSIIGCRLSVRSRSFAVIISAIRNPHSEIAVDRWFSKRNFFLF